MKIMIRESKRDIIAKKLLNKVFSEIYEKANQVTDSNGTKKRIAYNIDDDVIMLYMSGILYICQEITDELRVFNYTSKGIKNVVGEWFSEKFDLPVNIIQIVDKELLN